MNYQIICSFSEQDVSRRVSEAIDERWVPHGPLAVAPVTPGGYAPQSPVTVPFYSQAMTKGVFVAEERGQK